MFSLTVLDVDDQVSTDNESTTLYFVNVFDTDFTEKCLILFPPPP